ncbi:MAG TPA: polyprenol monophosphomannose synthase [Phycisphaerae bacterium]|nr:polyprenol monophosphomannose synthase [Phycisphaerae bacterium]
MPRFPFVPSVSVVVPTFKEAENLPLLIPQVAEALGNRGWVWEIIVVDDNSPDATKHVLDQLSARFPQVRALIRTTDRGLSSAVLAGIELAQHDYVVVMDADLSHPPEAIPSMIEKLTRGEADFVIGSRYVTGGKTEDWSRLRWLNSAGATLLAKPLVGTVKDPMAGFFAMRRETLRDADALNPIGYKIGLELIAKMHISPNRVAEVPITFRNRIHGESKLTMKEQFKYLEHLSRLYDYTFPKASPRLKFFIAAGAGTVACFAAMLALQAAHMPYPLSIAAGLISMIAVTLAFFVRYVHTQRAFLLMKRPYGEFVAISTAEFLAGWAFAVSTQSNIFVQTCVGLAAVLLVRYTLRKVFLHDLRGIRGTPTPNSTRRLTLMPQTPPTAASA